jgi:HD superfamily phosphohydrolase YqeK
MYNLTLHTVLNQADFQYLCNMQVCDKIYKQSSRHYIDISPAILHSMIKLEDDGDCMAFFVRSGKRSKENKTLLGSKNKTAAGHVIKINTNATIVSIEEKKILRQERQYVVHEESVMEAIKSENKNFETFYKTRVPVFFRENLAQERRVASVQPYLGETLSQLCADGNYNLENGVMAIDEALNTLHQTFAYHNDLKPQNFAYSIQNGRGGTSFGFS